MDCLWSESLCLFSATLAQSTIRDYEVYWNAIWEWIWTHCGEFGFGWQCSFFGVLLSISQLLPASQPLHVPLTQLVYIVGWAPWNLSCLEFKFDDTRLSYWHKNKIGRIEIFLLLPDFANFLPCWLAQFYVNRKVWYHQIWIPNNLGFIVSDLIYTHM